MITCPRCVAQYESVPHLAAHLAYTHAMSDTRAMDEAQRAGRACPGCGRSTGSHSKQCPNRETWTPPAAPAPVLTVVVTPPQPSPVTPAVEETPMADLSTPIPCKACGEKFVRKHARETYCPTCAKTPKCGYCKHRGDAHSPTCERGTGKAVKKPGATKPAGGGRAKKSKPARKTRAVARDFDARVTAKLDEAKADVTRLRGELARAEAKAELLMELAGA